MTNMETLPPRTRRPGELVRTSSVLDHDATFQPSKRPRLSAGDALEVENEPPTSSVSLIERLMEEVSYCTWRLSREQPMDVNEKYLNEQLASAAIVGGEKQTQREREMTFENARVEFSTLWTLFQAGNDASKQEKTEKLMRDAMDVVSWLLVLRQQEMTRQHATMDALRVMEKGVERKQNQIQQLHENVEILKQQMAQQENMFHGREQALVKERKVLQNDKKQLEVLCAKLQGQESAYKAQLRRKDAEYERLKKSLQDAVQRSIKDQRGMTIGKPLNDARDRKQVAAHRVVQTHETLMTKRLINNLEQKRDELISENDKLATNFETLQRQVESISAQYKKAVQLFLAQRGNENNTEETAALARMPIDDFTPAPLKLGVKTNVPAYISQTLESLVTKVQVFERAMQAEIDYKARNPSEDLIAALKEKLEDAHAIIAEQDRLLQASLCTSVTALTMNDHDLGKGKSHGVGVDKENVDINSGKLNPTWRAPALSSSNRHPGMRRKRVETVIMEQWAEELEAEWQVVRRKQKHLDNERTLLQTEGIKLDEDRIAFELRNFAHFFGSDASKEPEEIDMDGFDVPTTPRTAAYLQSIGIRATRAPFA
ncbi:hypothetical protein Poli38472_007952 [Pythium oligandrum]|uniref:Uncharacterized protein n=1 Tax=Pythium oligandrum TaxID=41045 RepID=A0A8K1FIS3_PYTOL|nr:hypothetical protein Poli38472_007952 [Pythium oligandrum]|eukprot:TMW65310.1 hypothetical protein Poli38472_007952 [Pythium oligandrum]